MKLYQSIGIIGISFIIGGIILFYYGFWIDRLDLMVFSLVLLISGGVITSKSSKIFYKKIEKMKIDPERLFSRATKSKIGFATSKNYRKYRKKYFLIKGNTDNSIDELDLIINAKKVRKWRLIKFSFGGHEEQEITEEYIPIFYKNEKQ